MMLYNAKKAIILKIVYVAFLATGTVFTLGFSVFNLSLYQIGKVFGTLSLSCLTLQLWMGARVRLLERGIGLDTILRWHSTNGRLTFLFMLLHPTFLFVPLLFRGMSLQALVSFFNVYHVLGITALLLTIFTIIVTVYQKELKLNYEHWKIIHKVGYVIIILGFAHSFFVGTDIIFRRPLYYWWIGLSILALSAVLYRYGARRWLLRKSMYETMKIVKENEHVRSIYLEPLRGKIFSYAPGQFAFVRFYTQRLSSEEHHFTISSSPLHNPLCFTVKESGDFTSQLDQLKKGDKAKIEGPFGTFSNVGMKGPFVCIAGGIGITPLMSMIRYAQDTNGHEKTLLLYSAQTRADLVFYDELEELQKHATWFRVLYFLSKERRTERKDKWYYGRITPPHLQKHVSNFSASKFFVVGPEPMMEEMKNMLLQLGAQKRNIFTERFALK